MKSWNKKGNSTLTHPHVLPSHTHPPTHTQAEGAALIPGLQHNFVISISIMVQLVLSLYCPPPPGLSFLRIYSVFYSSIHSKKLVQYLRLRRLLVHAHWMDGWMEERTDRQTEGEMMQGSTHTRLASAPENSHTSPTNQQFHPSIPVAHLKNSSYT